MHSISKRSNLAGFRAGFYTGDEEIVTYLRSVRQHAGFMVPGPVQAAAALAYNDDEHVTLQRSRYLSRLELLSHALKSIGVIAPLPEGAFYLWCSKEGLDGWEARGAAGRAFGAGGKSRRTLRRGRTHDFARIAVVQPDERLRTCRRSSRGVLGVKVRWIRE